MNKSSTTADDILACTRKLIVAGGYNGFSYADIADVASWFSGIEIQVKPRN